MAGHGVKKEACRQEHPIPEAGEMTGQDSHLEIDDSLISPQSRKRKSQGKNIKAEEDLNVSQVNVGTFCRVCCFLFAVLMNISPRTILSVSPVPSLM